MSLELQKCYVTLGYSRYKVLLTYKLYLEKISLKNGSGIGRIQCRSNFPGVYVREIERQ